MKTTLTLKSGESWEGISFGAQRSTAGEVVFATGMVGYPESLTDPSYAGQILVLTFPIAGSYGVPDASRWESDKIQVAGLVVSQYIDTPSSSTSKETLAAWLMREGIPAVEITDTRAIGLTLREQGATLGKIEIDEVVDFHDPNKDGLVDQVSTKEVITEGFGKKTVVLVDCGSKRQIKKELLNRGVKVITVPWDYPVFDKIKQFDGILISNGPGDPEQVGATIATIKTALKRKTPLLGICLGHQILALAGGGSTYKMKFGHRSQNQPCQLVGTEHCYLTTQNHGFAVSKIPPGFEPWFVNVHDHTNEGIRHKSLPIFSVQFHPEADPGPTDTRFIFDVFVRSL